MLTGLLQIIKSFFKAIKNFISCIKNAFLYTGKFIAGLFTFIKGLIDVVYRVVFIAFFCAIAYISYKVYTSAGSINKKLDEIKATVSYIQNITEEFSKSTDKVIEVSKHINNATGKISNGMNKASENASGFTKKIKNFFQ